MELWQIDVMGGAGLGDGTQGVPRMSGLVAEYDAVRHFNKDLVTGHRQPVGWFPGLLLRRLFARSTRILGSYAVDVGVDRGHTEITYQFEQSIES